MSDRTERIKGELIDTLESPEGAGSDLEHFEHSFDNWWDIRGALDLEHLVSVVEWLIDQEAAP